MISLRETSVEHCGSRVSVPWHKQQKTLRKHRGVAADSEELDRQEKTREDWQTRRAKEHLNTASKPPEEVIHEKKQKHQKHQCCLTALSPTNVPCNLFIALWHFLTYWWWPRFMQTQIHVTLSMGHDWKSCSVCYCKQNVCFIVCNLVEWKQNIELWFHRCENILFV